MTSLSKTISSVVLLLAVGCTHYKESNIKRGIPIVPFIVTLEEQTTIQDFKEFPRKTRRAFIDCDYHFTSDSNKAVHERLMLFREGGFAPDGLSGYIISCFPADTTFHSNRCMFFEIKGDSINSNQYRIPDSVQTIREALPLLKMENMMLFGGRTISPKEARKMARARNHNRSH